jgi:hypothetical protein
VGTIGADGRKALEVAAVSLTAKGMEPLSSLDVGSLCCLCWCGQWGDQNAHVCPIDRQGGEIQEDKGVDLAL